MTCSAKSIICTVVCVKLLPERDLITRNTRSVAQMPALTNHRRELFAQLLFQGFSAAKAYEKAGYRPHDGNACTLAKHPEVKARLEEIRGDMAAEKTGFPLGTNAIAARAKVTADSLIDEAEAVRAGAMNSHQYNAANGAIKTKSVLSGVWIERAEIGQPGEFDNLTDNEVERLLVEHLAELGWALVPAINDGSNLLNGALTTLPKDHDS
jgi:hypothetical protein